MTIRARVRARRHRRTVLRMSKEMADLLRWACSERDAFPSKKPAHNTVRVLLRRRWLKRTGVGAYQLDITHWGRRALDRFETRGAANQRRKSRLRAPKTHLSTAKTDGPTPSTFSVADHKPTLIDESRRQ